MNVFDNTSAAASSTIAARVLATAAVVEHNVDMLGLPPIEMEKDRRPVCIYYIYVYT